MSLAIGSRSRSTVALAFLATSLSQTAAAQCIDYGDYIRWVGVHGVYGSGVDVTVSGHYAYLLTSTDTLHVLDLSNPAAPVVVGGSDDFNYPRGIVVRGDYAYVSDWSFPFKVLDVSNPANPVTVGSLPHHPTEFRQLAVVGDYAYVAASRQGLWILDISDPTAPTFVSSVTKPGDRAHDVDVQGDYAYLAVEHLDDNTGSLRVIDVTDPTAPEITGGVVLTDDPREVEVAGDYAYVGAGISLEIVDITNPAAPVITASLEEPVSWAGSVSISGNRAYLGGWDGLAAVDISDPTAPQRHGTVPLPGTTGASAVFGNHVYAAAEDLNVIDVSHVGAPPALVGNTSISAYALDADVSGDHAYIAGSSAGLKVVDVSNPTSPQVVGDVDTPGVAARAVAVSGDHAFIADHNALQVADIFDPTAPVLVGSVAIPHIAKDVAVSGDYAYVAARNSGIEVVDVSDPTAPIIVGGGFSSGDAVGITISGNRAYVANTWSMFVADISDPPSFEILGSSFEVVPDRAWDVAVQGSIAYVVGRLSGLAVIDVSDPTALRLLATVPTPDESQAVTVLGHHVYVASGPSEGSQPTGSIQVIDVSNPAAPVIVGAYHALGEPQGVTAANGLLYIADHAEGLEIIVPQCAGSVPVHLSGFRADAHDGVVDLTWFTSLEFLHEGFRVYRSRSLVSGFTHLNDGLVRGSSPYSYTDATVQPRTIYFYRLGAVSTEGTEEMHDPIQMLTPAWDFRPTLSLAAPNPFASHTKLAFSLPVAEHARVDVYDVGGRHVRTIVDGDLPRGDHAAVWDARDERALRVAGGTYFVRLQVAEETLTRKIVLVGE